MSALIETLASYVPVLITRRMVADSTPLIEPVADSFPAAVLCADISGCTLLTEHLSGRGSAGTEELTNLLNIYFGQLIDLINDQGGDVIKFAGNSLLAVWPARAGLFPGLEDDLGIATQRAVQCGWAIQQQLGLYEPIRGIQLALRLTIGTGQVSALQLGGVFQRWEFLITGKPLSQVRLAERYAQPGEVVVSRQAWMLVRDDYSGQPLEAGNVRLENIHKPLPPKTIVSSSLSSKAENALRAYIPGAVLTHLAAGQNVYLAELLPISVLFINLPDLNDSIPLAQAQVAMKTLQETLYRYEGSINKLSVDDQGATLIAALGLPPLTHEDDAARAVQAAIAIQLELQTLKLRGSIGLTTGRTFCGSVGNKRRREYTMIGHAVNLAAHLMHMASEHNPNGGDFTNSDNSIICDEATYQALGSQVEFDTLPAITIKDKIEPIVIYQPKIKTPSTQFRSHGTSASHFAADEGPKSKPQMIGRVKAKGELADHIQAMLRGTSNNVIIEGQAGIGKSRLVVDMLAHAQTVGAITLMGTGQAAEKQTPYHAWRLIFYQLFELGAPTDSLYYLPERLSEAQQKQVLSYIEANMPHMLKLAPLLNIVLPLDMPENNITNQMTGEVRADNTYKILINLLQVFIAQSHPLLIMEDAHWLDSASWTLLNRVSQDIHPIMLVVVIRHAIDSQMPAYRHLLESPNTYHIHLTPLSEADTLNLVFQHLGVESLPKPVLNLIIEKTQGYPLYSQELAYALHDADVIHTVKGQCYLNVDFDNLHTLKFSNTLQDVITSRINHLSPPQQLMLKVASVIGHVFTLSMLSDLCLLEEDKAQLADYLDTLEQVGLISFEMSELDQAYSFRHRSIQKTAYNLLPFDQRQKLHQIIVSHYENIHPANLSPYYPLLAHHWSKVTEIDNVESSLVLKAIDYLEKAGQQAMHNYANHEALDFFSRIITLNDQFDVDSSQLQLARWQRHLGQAYFGLGNLQQSRQHLHQALTLLDALTPLSYVQLIGGIVKQIGQQTLHLIWPTRFIGRTSDKRDCYSEVMNIYEQSIKIYLLNNQLSLSLVYEVIRAVNLAESSGKLPEVALFYALLGSGCSLMLHQQIIAKMYIGQAQEIVQDMTNLPKFAFIQVIIGGYYGSVGNWKQADEAFVQAIRIFDKIGAQAHWMDFVIGVSWIRLFQGKFAPAATGFADAITVSQRKGYSDFLATGLIGQAIAALRLERDRSPLRAKNCAQAVLKMMAEKPNHSFQIMAYGTLAIAYLRYGKHQDAYEAAEKGLQLIREASPLGFYELEGYASITEAYLLLWKSSLEHLSLFGEPKIIAKSAQQACRGLHKFARAIPIARPRAWLWQGVYNWLSGQHGRAYRAWKRSLAYAQRLEMPYEEGLAHYEIGRHSQGKDRVEHLNQAIEIFERLRVTYDLGQARRAVTQTDLEINLQQEYPKG